VFLSQPMAGLSKEEITKARNAIMEHLELNAQATFGYPTNFELLPSYVENATSSLDYFVQGLQQLPKADVAVFAKGWNKARGCLMEHQIASAYGVRVITQDENGNWHGL